MAMRRPRRDNATNKRSNHGTICLIRTSSKKKKKKHETNSSHPTPQKGIPALRSSNLVRESSSINSKLPIAWQKPPLPPSRTSSLSKTSDPQRTTTSSSTSPRLARQNSSGAPRLLRSTNYVSSSPQVKVKQLWVIMMAKFLIFK